jgi:hypothetical protein
VLRAGTQIPKFFTLHTVEGSVFVKESATKHFTDLIKASLRVAERNSVINSAAITKGASSLVLESFEGAVSKALKNPFLELDTPVVVDGWELIFGEELAEGFLKRIVYHAVPK